MTTTNFYSSIILAQRICKYIRIKPICFKKLPIRVLISLAKPVIERIDDAAIYIAQNSIGSFQGNLSILSLYFLLFKRNKNINQDIVIVLNGIKTTRTFLVVKQNTAKNKKRLFCIFSSIIY